MGDVTKIMVFGKEIIIVFMNLEKFLDVAVHSPNLSYTPIKCCLQMKHKKFQKPYVFETE